MGENKLLVIMPNPRSPGLRPFNGLVAITAIRWASFIPNLSLEQQLRGRVAVPNRVRLLSVDNNKLSGGSFSIATKTFLTAFVPNCNNSGHGELTG